MPSTRKTSVSIDGDEPADPLYVTALARGLKVLACIAQSPEDLSVTEVARSLGLPQSTVWRSCHTLIKHGYLVRTHGERLRPGLAVLGLGHAALARQPLAQLARPGMEDIASSFRGAVSLGVPQGLEMLYLARVEGGPVIYPGLRAGSRVGMLSSAMGWAYLAGLPARRRVELLDKAKAQSGEQYERVSSQLAEAIQYFERHKVLLNSGVIHPELNAIAIPIGPDGRVPLASISFGGLQAEYPASRLQQEVAPRLAELAASLTACLEQGTALG
jgi:DNA-binding IclR family transcriptional regulator